MNTASTLGGNIGFIDDVWEDWDEGTQSDSAIELCTSNKSWKGDPALTW